MVGFDTIGPGNQEKEKEIRKHKLKKLKRRAWKDYKKMIKEEGSERIIERFGPAEEEINKFPI